MSTAPSDPVPPEQPGRSNEVHPTTIAAITAAALCAVLASVFAMFVSPPPSVYIPVALLFGGIIGFVCGTVTHEAASSANPQSAIIAVAFGVARSFVDWTIRLLLLAWLLIWAKVALPLYFESLSKQPPERPGVTKDK